MESLKEICQNIKRIAQIQGVLAIRGFVFRGFAIRGFAIRGFLEGFKSSYFAVYPQNSRFFQAGKHKKYHFFVLVS